MIENTLILDGDESIDQANLKDGMGDIESAADGNVEQEVIDEAADLDAPEDDDFKLDGYNDLGIIEEENEDEDDCDADSYDLEDDDTINGQKRKRVKLASHVQMTRSLQHSAARTQASSAEAFILDEDDGFPTKLSSRVPGTFGRRGRKKSETLPAYHKRVSHELDSDDELMLAMREKGFSDRQIAEKLAKDGRVRYDQKSISTRIMRIRLAQADNVDFLLREGYKEWEFEDDCLLVQANALADIEINYEIERIRAWRFRKVSEYMRRLNKEALYSATACRERYNALVEGVARIPTEMDDDPDARRLELETFRESREQARNIEQEEKDAKEALERKTKGEARTRNAQKAEEIAYKRQQKEEEKAQRAMQRATAAQIRSQRAQEHAISKAQRNAQIKKQKIASKKASRSKGKGNATPKQAPTLKGTLPLINTDITADTPDPRSCLSIADITRMCADRGIQTPDKSKDQLLSDLQNVDEEWSQQDLKKMCRSKGLNNSGSKIHMRHQLALAAAQACKSFRAGVDAALEDGDEMVDDEE